MARGSHTVFIECRRCGHKGQREVALLPLPRRSALALFACARTASPAPSRSGTRAGRPRRAIVSFPKGNAVVRTGDPKFHGDSHAGFHATRASSAPSINTSVRERSCSSRSIRGAAASRPAPSVPLRTRATRPATPATIRLSSPSGTASPKAAIPASAGVTLPRTYAMMHIAMFDAVNSIEGGYTAYRVRVPALARRIQ